ncbi:MAG: hypothetical protein J5449_05510 [Oscillospiraceae bacterium]|nr:hypothetical protein [Oscillospiraceae bacterium]
MWISKRDRRAAALYLCALVLIHVADVLLDGQPFGRSVTPIGYAAIICAWGSGLSVRIVNARIRRLFTALAGSMLLWFFLQTCKYDVFSGALCRYIWYGYYISVISIPLLSFSVSLCVGVPEDARPPRFVKWLWLAGGVFAALCLSNDLHMLLFRFDGGIDAWEGAYTHGALYYLALLWAFALMAASFAAVLRRCPVALGRKYVLLPPVPLLLSVIYLILSASFPGFLQINGRSVLHFQQVFSLAVLLFWESCIGLGLIRTNHGYDRLFQSSGTSAALLNSDGSIALRSAGMERWSAEELNAKRPGSFLDDGKRIGKAPVRGGEAVWIEDVSELVAVRRRLAEVRMELEEEGDILRAETEFRAIRSAVETRARIYDRITSALADKSRRINELLSLARTGDAKKRLCEVAVLGAYMKRWSNLAILSVTGTEGIPVSELGLSLGESIEHVRLLGTECRLEEDADGETADGTELLFLYECFEAVLEELLWRTDNLFVSLGAQNGAVTLRLLADPHAEQHAAEKLRAMTRLKADAPFTASLRAEDGADGLSLALCCAAREA